MSSPKVMVVDDDIDLLEIMSELLVNEGLEVNSQEHAVEALSLLRNGFRPDVILLDLMMPEMNGWQFRAAQLADVTISQIPVIIMSASANPDTTALAPTAVLRKPVDIDSLVRHISSLSTSAQS